VTISVVVADDQALLRAGLRGILDSAPDLVVVGQAADGREAVEVVRRERPDVVLMDIRMPVMDGLDATKVVTADTGSKVLILTTFDLDEYVFTALRNGASGFLLKDTPPEELLVAVRTIAAGDALLGPGITRRLIHEFVARPAEPDRPSGAAASGDAPDLAGLITERELDVFQLVAAGFSNAEIGERLHIGTGTAKTHVAHLLAKLAARDRVQLVILAHQSGLADQSLVLPPASRPIP
jgi:DNA-binding NarL/FixJ family response regulator